MHIESSNDMMFKLTGMRYVHGCKRSLISVRKLDDGRHGV